MKIIFTNILIFCLIITFGQDSTGKTQVPITKNSFGRYFMNGNKLSQKELKAELFKVPAAIPVYKKAKRNETISIISSLAGLGCVLLDKPRTNSIPYKQHNGWFWGGIALTGNSVFFLLQSLNLVKKAVQIRNDNLKAVY